MNKFPEVAYPDRPAHPDDQAKFVAAWLEEIEKNPTPVLVNHATRTVLSNLRDPTLARDFLNKIFALPGISREDIYLHDIVMPGRIVMVTVQVVPVVQETKLSVVTLFIVAMTMMALGVLMSHIFGS